jgi:hypothetical protein
MKVQRSSPTIGYISQRLAIFLTGQNTHGGLTSV